MSYHNDNDVWAIQVLVRAESDFQSAVTQIVPTKSPLSRSSCSYSLERLCKAYPILRFRKIRNGKPGPWLAWSHYERETQRRLERIGCRIAR